MALAEYDARGRIYDGPQDRVYDDAVDLYMTDIAPGVSRCCWPTQREGRPAGPAGP